MITCAQPSPSFQLLAVCISGRGPGIFSGNKTCDLTWSHARVHVTHDPTWLCDSMYDPNDCTAWHVITHNHMQEVCDWIEDFMTQRTCDTIQSHDPACKYMWPYTITCDPHTHIWSQTITCDPSLVPRPHPLTRRNGLVNQVEFLGLAHALRQCNLATIKTFWRPTHSKKVDLATIL